MPGVRLQPDVSPRCNHVAGLFTQQGTRLNWALLSARLSDLPIFNYHWMGFSG
jgi:hypothetical protein